MPTSKKEEEENSRSLEDADKCTFSRMGPREGDREEEGQEVSETVGMQLQHESSEEKQNQILEKKRRFNPALQEKDPFADIVAEGRAPKQKEEDVVLEATWGTRTVRLSLTPIDFDTFSLLDLKRKIESELNIPCDKQKLLGLTSSVSKQSPVEDELLCNLKYRKGKSFVLVGTSMDRLLMENVLMQTLNVTVTNDLGWDYVPSVDTSVTVRTPVHLNRLQRAIDKTEIHLIHRPRPGKKLLVLDLDYTLFDCKSTNQETGEQCRVFTRGAGQFWFPTGNSNSNASTATTITASGDGTEVGIGNTPLGDNLVGGSSSIEDMKRPFLEYFMENAYDSYDLAIWSQTHWKWVEMKCTELGFLTSKKFSLCFVLDRSSMFTVSTPQKDGKERTHEVKALEVIWAKFPDRWGPHNTLHVDDLSRNFVMNPKNGVKVSAYRAVRRRADSELLQLSNYLARIAAEDDVTAVDHTQWKKSIKYTST